MEVNKSYKQTIQVNCSPEKAFKALTSGIQFWWGNVEGVVTGVGDEFIVTWGDPWYKFKVSEYNLNKAVTWDCIDANQIINGLEGVQKEWIDTSLKWIIKKVDDKSIEISLVHEGLVPDFICYDFCSTTWDRFITNELKNSLIK